MRPIDADRLLEEKRMHTYYHLPNGDIAIPLIDIKNAPTIESNQGEWIITEQDNGHKWTHRKCSECGKGIIEPLGVSGMNYCPNCGARMKGADDE